jgi:plastocyanin
MTTNVSRRPLRTLLMLLLAAAAATGTSACGGDENGSSGASGTKITIKDFSYSPNPLEAKVGETVTVTNDDGTPHTLTADDDSTVSTGELSGGQSGTIALTKAGTLAYHCEIHGTTMKGSIQVSA